MTYNELRKHYFLDQWAVIATARARRPSDFAKKTREQSSLATTCPMDPGNEHMTPPAILVYLKKGKGIRKAKDDNGTRQKDWLIRVVPNLYPAFSPPQKKTSPRQKDLNYQPALGHHEVLVESPIHSAHPADAEISQLLLLIEAYKDRFRELAAKPYVKYVSIFRNHGLEAGASLSHAHSQIIATSIVPPIVEDEMKASLRHLKQKKKCLFCEIIKKERDSPRLILENQHFVAFAAYAGMTPMEFWIMPKRHQATILDMTPTETRAFAVTLKTCLKALKQLVNDPPYNYGFHLALNKKDKEHYHWHVEIYPKLAIWAGFELNTGTYINTVSPETAAEEMKKTISV